MASSTALLAGLVLSIVTTGKLECRPLLKALDSNEFPLIEILIIS